MSSLPPAALPLLTPGSQGLVSSTLLPNRTGVPVGELACYIHELTSPEREASLNNF